MVAGGEIPVMGGFIAASRGGETTTLGAAARTIPQRSSPLRWAHRELQIWTDVTGVMTCDPRVCPDARTIPVLVLR